MYWARLFVIFQEIQCLLNFHYDVGHQGLEIDPCTKCLFLCQLHAHTYICQSKCIGRDCFLLFSEKYIILTMSMFVGSRSFISLPSFMFVGAAVSEIRELNRNKEEKNLQSGYFQFNTFPRHIIDPFFHQSYLFCHIYTLNYL